MRDFRLSGYLHGLRKIPLMRYPAIAALTVPPTSVYAARDPAEMSGLFLPEQFHKTRAASRRKSLLPI